MDRSMPVSANKYLQKIWDEKAQELHKAKLRSIKSRIDRKSPLSYSHIKRNAKKERQLEERCTEIERENRLLLEKMSVIVQHRSKSTSKFSKPITLRPCSRQRSIQQLLKDNSSFVKRLKSQNSSYSQAKFVEDRREQENILNRISEYPFQLGYNKRLPRCRSAKKTLDKSKIVYMKTVEIEGKRFDIEIYKNSQKITTIAFTGEEMYKLIIGNNEAAEVMNYKDDYESLISRLSYENGCLIMID